MAEDDETGKNEGAAGTPLDASLRVDPRTLSGPDQDFARMMGFGEEGAPPAAASPSTPIAVAEIPEPPASEPEAGSETASDDAEPAPIADETAGEAVADPTVEAEPVAASGPGDPAREWDEIHPRAATLGRQSALIERAERVLTLPSVTAGAPVVVPAPTPAAVSAPQPGFDESIWQARLRASEERISALEDERLRLEDALSAARREAAPRAVPSSELEKELERMRGELDGLLVERERLGDELSVARAARADAIARAERLETAYRSTRGAQGPLPEGERDLRAEVVGLRRRLEESGVESRRLRESLDASATELAIARAHADDRQQELEQQREQIGLLERDRTSQIERLEESLARQRELLALVARVQAENVELRSTQAALEETLEARDLEISAREEHLLVTRRGLAARDAQLIDAEERLEQERHRRELIETELDRARLAHAELAEGLARRDARIATLSTTLARVEDAIGRPLSAPGTRGDEGATDSPAPSRAAALAGSNRASDRAAHAHEEDEASASAATPGADAAEAVLASEPDEAMASGAAPTGSSAGSDAATEATALPGILAPWRDAQLAHACGGEQGSTVAEFLARRLAAHAATGGLETVRVTSLGGARSEAELELADAYRALGTGALSICVLDRSPEAAERRRQAVDAAGLADTITVYALEDADRALETPAHALLFVDALEGAGDGATEGAPMDALVERMAASLEGDGIALFAGRLAGGPVSLSETTCEKLAELWLVLPETWTGRPGFEAPPGPGDDGGTPELANEARAALWARFQPTVTVGLGHVVDLFLGPARGFDLADAGEAAQTLLASIDAIDESRSILESLPARHGVAVLAQRAEAAAEAGADDASAAVEAIGLPWPDSLR